MTTPVPSFLIGSSSFLQAPRTPINSQLGSKLCQIGPWTVKLAALDCLGNLHRLTKMEKYIFTPSYSELFNTRR